MHALILCSCSHQMHHERELLPADENLPVVSKILLDPFTTERQLVKLNSKSTLLMLLDLTRGCMAAKVQRA